MLVWQGLFEEVAQEDDLRIKDWIPKAPFRYCWVWGWVELSKNGHKPSQENLKDNHISPVFSEVQVTRILTNNSKWKFPPTHFLLFPRFFSTSPLVTSQNKSYASIPLLKYPNVHQFQSGMVFNYFLEDWSTIYRKLIHLPLLRPELFKEQFINKMMQKFIWFKSCDVFNMTQVDGSFNV